MRFQFLFSLLMRFQFISVYCLFFFACKDTMRVKGGLGNRGRSNYMCPNNISGNGRSKISFLYGRLRGRVQMVFERNGHRRCRLAIGGKRRSNAALTRGARDKKHITNTYRQGCRYVIGGLLLDNNYRQLTNNFWFSTLFLLDNNYRQLANNFFLSFPF